VCIAHSREALCVYGRVYRGTVFVLHSVERYCVRTALSRDALCVCTVQNREALYVYCTV